MLENTLPVLIARLDFAWITTFHILYPPLTIGLAGMLFVGELLWLRTNDEYWYRLTRFFERLLIVNFAAGVATGVTMEMAFGILYGPFAQAAGPFFGQVLGYETITAFMYEAGFIGLMIFGWGKISRGMHLFATFNVALSSAISAMWILDANSWMQTPTGVELRHGAFHVTSWVKSLLNPDVIYAFPHMLVACYELALVFVGAISAWYLIRNRHVAMFRRSLHSVILALLVVAPLQIWLGDSLGVTVANHQKTVLAAMEGHYHTYNPDGSINTSWKLVAWPNAKNDGTVWSISIPHVLSLLETHTWGGKVTGLDEFPADKRPPILVPFYAFRVMVGCAFGVMLLALWGGWMLFRHRLMGRTTHNVWFLRAFVATAALPYIAIWVGWWTREVGRQPWVVAPNPTGVQQLRLVVSQGVSDHPTSTVVVSLVTFTVLYGLLAIAWGTLMTRYVIAGPSDHDKHPPGSGHDDDADADQPAQLSFAY